MQFSDNVLVRKSPHSEHRWTATEQEKNRSSSFARFAKRQLKLVVSRLRQLVANQRSQKPGDYSSTAIDEMTRLIDVGDQTRRVLSRLACLPSVPHNGVWTPRIVLLAREYLSYTSLLFSPDGFHDFLVRSEPLLALNYAELLHVPLALRLSVLLCVLEPMPAKGPVEESRGVPHLADADQAIKDISCIDLEKFVDGLVPTERLLLSDYAAIYDDLNSSSKMIYRAAVVQLSRSWKLSEEAICQGALQLSREQDLDKDKRLRYRTHIGYFLLDRDGIKELKKHLRPTFAEFSLHSVIPGSPLSRSLTIYLCGTLMATLLFLRLCSPPGTALRSSVLSFLVIVVLTSQCMRNLIAVGVEKFTRPSELPRLNFDSGIPREYLTVVAIPCVLRSSRQLEWLKRHLRGLFSAIKDPNVYIVLLTDCPDSEDGTSTQHQDLVDELALAIKQLNEQHQGSDHQPYILLHRALQFSEIEGKWIGWERKRGKIIQLVRYISHGDNQFLKVVGEHQQLRDAKYILVLDEDSRLAMNAVHILVGTHVHPLNHAILDGKRDSVVRGFGILAPTVNQARLDDSVPDGNETLAAIPRRNWIQDLLGQCVFVGKGMLQVAAYDTLLGRSLPEGVVLTHDMLESGFVRVGAATEAVVLEKLAARHEVSCKRRHRWARGDWQNARFLFKHGEIKRTPSLFGKLLIVENIRDTLQPVAIVLLWLKLGFGQNQVRLLWLILLPIFAPLLENMTPFVIADSANGVCRSLIGAIRKLGKLALWWVMEFSRVAHDALVSIDAMLKAVVRSTRRQKLLDWESYSVSEEARGVGVCYIHQVSAAVISVALIIVAVALSKYVLLGIGIFWLAGACRELWFST